VGALQRHRLLEEPIAARGSVVIARRSHSPPALVVIGFFSFLPSLSWAKRNQIFSFCNVNCNSLCFPFPKFCQIGWNEKKPCLLRKVTPCLLHNCIRFFRLWPLKIYTCTRSIFIQFDFDRLTPLLSLFIWSKSNFKEN
jgi:hypothetical protein